MSASFGDGAVTTNQSRGLNGCYSAGFGRVSQTLVSLTRLPLIALALDDVAHHPAYLNPVAIARVNNRIRAKISSVSSAPRGEISSCPQGPKLCGAW